MSPSSKQKFSYASNDESFTLENISNSTHNFISGIGFDFISENENGIDLLKENINKINWFNISKNPSIFCDEAMPLII